eukprot:COSAG02_NODE_472_length_21636_cov_767.911366_12_plen_80_part_00
MFSLKSALANQKDDGRPASLRGRVRHSAAPVFEQSVKSKRTLTPALCPGSRQAPGILQALCDRALVHVARVFTHRAWPP